MITKAALTLLSARATLRVKGPASVDFLQGLITNDMHHLQQGIRSMYTMFLNPKGRVLFDSLVYSTVDSETFLIECDCKALSRLEKHLNMFKIRKNVNVESIKSNVWALYDKLLDENSLLKNGCINVSEEKSDINFYIDPRVSQVGMRIIAPDSIKIDDIVGSIKSSINVDQCNLDIYKQFRYRLGLSEGLEEIPSDNSFPLEANCDYLHGVSFHKGCYIGQELTARTHHTGVVRKRLMPILFEKEVDNIPNDTPIYNFDSSKSIGKVRGVSKNVGIGLMRIAEALASPYLIINGNKANTYRPKWWPLEVTKEK